MFLENCYWDRNTSRGLKPCKLQDDNDDDDVDDVQHFRKKFL